MIIEKPSRAFQLKSGHPLCSELNRYAVISCDRGGAAFKIIGRYQSCVFAGARLPETLDQVIPK
jgi:hypothetical protein